MAKIVHMTTVHKATDARIFEKECRSLSAVGHDVVLLLYGSDGGDLDGIEIRTLQGPRGRVRRMTQGVLRMWLAALKERADLYHFHDPELMVAGWLLRAGGNRVIYDVHEDFPKNILTKHYIWLPLRKILGGMVSLLEHFTAFFLSGVVAATPAIGSRFPARKTRVVKNYPRLEEFADLTGPTPNPRQLEVIYAGGLSESRGVVEMIAAARLWSQQVDARLVIAGSCVSRELEQSLRSIDGWLQVDYLGWLSRRELVPRLQRARVGLVVLHPTSAFVDSLPVKLFEYMAAGVPVIASNFRLWESIVAEADCGLTVDPLDVAAIANAVRWMLEHPAEARAMGENGRRAVREHYNWESEGATLTAFYNELLCPSQ